MKIDTGRAESFLTALPAHLRLVLIYGPDQSLVRERVAAVTRQVAGSPPDPMAVTVIPGATAAKEPGRLIDAAATVPLLGGRGLVRVDDAGDTLTKALSPLFTLPEDASLVVVSGGDLPPRSSLRKLCEAQPAAAAIACYPLDDRAAAQFIKRSLQDQGLHADADTISLLGSRLGNDRQIIRQEIGKLALFCGDERTVTIESAAALVGDSQDSAVDAMVYAVADREASMADQALSTLLAAGTSEIAVLRALQRHFTALRAGTAMVADRVPPETAVERLRLGFFKTRGRIINQLRRWRRPEIDTALGTLVDAEARCKTSTVAPATICRQALLTILRS